MRAIAAVLVVAALGVCTAAAHAANVTVRVEGATTTLFEDQIETTPHLLRAASDTEDRVCDTTNAGAQPAPGPSATGALDDAAALGGFDWDGFWSPLDDYFVSRIGPDAQDDDNFRYWGVLVNGVFTEVGGCQAPVTAGDEVLWAYDAFNPTKALRLSGPAAVDPGEEVELHVVDTLAPTKDPVEGAAIGTLTTDTTGTATTQFAQPGLVELKATHPSAIRSNRLEICVRADANDDCVDDPPPADPLPPIVTPPITGTGSQPAQIAKAPAKSACAGLKGSKRKRCKALAKCSKLKKKSKRTKCRAKARKIGSKPRR